MARLTPYPLRDILLGSAPGTLIVLGVAVALVLLIAVANVTSLMLVRSLERWREVALRAVLGASRGRLLRWAITESVLLAVVGGALGLAAGQFFLTLLQTIGPRLPRLDQAHLDLTAVAFAVVLVLMIGVAVGAYPVFLLLRRTSSVGLRDGARTVGGGRATHVLRGALVAAEFALALPLLAGAALLLNSFLRLRSVNPGFDPRVIYTVRVSLPAATYRGDSAIAPFWRQALAGVQQLPGVVSAGVSNVMPPLDPSIGSNNFDLLDHPVPPGSAQPTSPWPGVDAGYFGALQVPLIEGRLLNPGDTAMAPPVVVVSRAWARHYFPEGNVVGRKLISGGCTACPPTTIVGMVGDVKYNGLDSASDAVYYPMYAGWSRDMTLFVRTVAPSTAIGPQVKAVLRSLDPGLPLDDAAPMLDRLQGSVAQPRHLAGMLGGFAFIALMLAAVGIFGMLSYTVNMRRQEIGVRMALGAQQGNVVGLVVRRGMMYAVVGAAIGLVAAVVVSRQLAGVLFQVSATDPVTLACATLILLVVAAAASWLPARRAARLDPVTAIRVG